MISLLFLNARSFPPLLVYFVPQFLVLYLPFVLWYSPVVIVYLLALCCTLWRACATLSCYESAKLMSSASRSPAPFTSVLSGPAASREVTDIPQRPAFASFWWGRRFRKYAGWLSSAVLSLSSTLFLLDHYTDGGIPSEVIATLSAPSFFCGHLCLVAIQCPSHLAGRACPPQCEHPLEALGVIIPWYEVADESSPKKGLCAASIHRWLRAREALSLHQESTSEEGEGLLHGNASSLPQYSASHH